MVPRAATGIAAVEAVELTKIYSSTGVTANDEISFSVAPGEAFGLLGPNGAGKTTLVRQLVGLLTPTGGRIEVFGAPVDHVTTSSGAAGAEERRRVAERIAYLPQGSLALGELTVSEAIRWTGSLRGLGAGAARMQARDLCGPLALEGLEDRPLRRLSGGQRRLVQIAMTLVGCLPVLILDEPTADIDPALRARIWELVAARADDGAAVILVTHDVAEAEHVLDHVAILHHGKVVASGSPARLKARLAGRARLEFVVAESASVDPSVIAADLGSSVQIRGRAVSAWVPASDAVRLLEKVIAASGLDALEDVRLVTPTLEDVYLKVAASMDES